MAGVYISYPFCRQKCTYCNFASGVFRGTVGGEYLEALENEIRAHRWASTPDTVYLGGGSPDRIAPGDLERLLELVPGRPWSEATLEAAPGSITADLTEAWVRLGIDRVSLGVQSFVEEEIRATARNHTGGVVAADVETLRRAGIEKINIDLIAGLPGQTRAELAGIARLDREARRPGTFRCTCWRWTKTAGWDASYWPAAAATGRRDVPEPTRLSISTKMAVERLAAMGLRRYEISNFARPGVESLHNLKYWRLEPYVGFGADAHSFDGDTAARECGNGRRIRGSLARREVVGRGGAATGATRRGALLCRAAAGRRDRARRSGGPLAHAEPIRRFVEGGPVGSATGDSAEPDGAGILFPTKCFRSSLRHEANRTASSICEATP